MLSRISQKFSSFAISSNCRTFYTAAATATSELTNPFPRFSSIAEISQYAETQGPSMNPQTIAEFLKYSGSVCKRFPDWREFRNCNAIKSLVASAVKLFPNEDLASASNLLGGVAKLVSGREDIIPGYLKNAGDAFKRYIVANTIPFSPDNFSYILGNICSLQACDLEVNKLVEKQGPKFVSQMSPTGCRNMIIVMHKLSMVNSDLFRSVVDRLTEQVDQFKNVDVAGSLSVLADVNYYSQVVVQHCSNLLAEHATLFNPEELISCSESLVKFKSFTPLVWRPVLEEVQKQMRVLRVFELSRLLDVLCSVGASQSVFADDVVNSMASSEFPKSFIMECNMAFAICLFNLQSRKALLQTLINSILNVEQVGKRFVPRILEIVESAKCDWDMKVELPSKLRSGIDEYHASKEESNKKYFLFVKRLIDQLPENFRLSLEPGVAVGPFQPLFVDKKNKIAVEVNDGSVYHLRRHLYGKLGYFLVLFNLRGLGRNIDEADKIKRVEFQFHPAMVHLGRMTQEQMNAMRDARDGYRKSSF